VTVSRSNSRINATDTFVATVHSVKISVAFRKHVMKSMGRSLSVMAHLKKIIVEVKTEENCLAHALLMIRNKIRIVEVAGYVL